MTRRPQIVALGGAGIAAEPDHPQLHDYILGLTGKQIPRICFLATAKGDAEGYIQRFYEVFPPERAAASHLPLFKRKDDGNLRDFLLSQDVLYVGGGNTANLLAVWRVHGVDRIVREAWQAGVILTGVSAGMICWYEESLTDSFGLDLDPLADGLGFLPGSACPHYDSEDRRRPRYQGLVGSGALADGVAADDGVGLHYVGTNLERAVSAFPDAGAYRVERRGGHVVESAIEVDCLA